MRYLMTIVCSLIFGNLIGQLDLYNNSVLYVEQNSLLYVKGSFINGHAEFENNGEFMLEGNLENEVAIEEEGSGLLRLVGSQNQLVNLTGEFKTFNLEIDNINGATFEGDQDLSVFGDLDFVNGRFWTRNNNLINFKENALYFGASDGSYIDGPAIKEGYTSFRYPIGKEGKLRPLEVLETGSNNGYQAEYFANTHQIMMTDESLESVSDLEYWSFDSVFGTTDPQISLVSYDDSFVNEPADDVQIGYTEGFDTWTRVNSSFEIPEQLSGDLTSIQEIPAYGFFTFASTNGNTFLRDGLIDFTLVKEGCNVRINWDAIERIGRVSSYHIEKRVSPSREYESVASFTANNTRLIDEYTVLDQDVEDGVIYHYRLVVIYKDGTFSTSDEQLIKANCAKISLELYPNPVFTGGFLTLVVNSEIEKDLEISIVDVLGRVLHSQIFEVQIGRNSFELANTIHYGAAEYFIWTPEEENIPTIKFQVIR